MESLGRLGTMRRRIAIAAGAGAMALLLMATMLFSSAFAQSTPTTENGATPEAGTSESGQTTDEGVYQDFLGKLAANLGISDPATVDMAIRTTLKQLVDEKQASGNITAEQANALKERIDADDFPRDLIGIGALHRTERDGRFGRGERGVRPGLPRVATGVELDQLANFFGESTDDLKAELRQGMSLAEIAAAHGKTTDELKTFLTDQFESRIDAIINAGSANQPAPSNATPSVSATPSI